MKKIFLFSGIFFASFAKGQSYLTNLTGGTAGQVLMKTSSVMFDYGWQTPTTYDSVQTWVQDNYYSKSQGDSRYVLKSDSVPSGVYMTKTAANSAVATIEAEMAALTTTTIAEGTNLYYTNARARAAVSLTVTGTSGAATYNNSTGVLNVPQYANSGGTVTSIGLTSSDFSVSGSPVTTSGSITANLNTSGVTAGTYNASYTVNNKGIVTAATNASFNTSPGRVLSTTGSNNTFTISATKNARVTYTVNFSIALVVAASNGVVTLDYSTDGGSNWTTIASASQQYSVAVTLTTNNDQVLSGEIPANALVRIYRSTATNCTVALSTSKQQEVTY